MPARPKLILLDLLMPVLDGVGFLRAREGVPWLKEIPIVAMSVLKSTAAEVKDRVDGFLIKPASADELLQAISPFVSRRVSRRADRNGLPLPR